MVMAYIKFAEKDEARAFMLLLLNRVPHNCYPEGPVFELPDSVLERLTQSAVSFEHVDTPPEPVQNGSRISVRLVGGVAPRSSVKTTTL